MIEAALNGRLGNWLFQYAAARCLALDRQTGVVLDVSRFVSWRRPLARHVVHALQFFRLDATYSRAGESRRWLERVGAREPRREYIENGWGYRAQFHGLGPYTRLRGYFQSPRYWRGHEAQLKADLAPARLPDDAAFEGLRDEIETTAAIALHVRRGDYLTSERELHHVCSDAYYERAIDFVRERVSGAKLYVFSDDLAWCRERYAASDAVVVDLQASRAEPGLDLYLMSRCRHHVISNSTYAWWGAWLASSARQIVCAPERWFNDDAMSRIAMRDTVPAEWHRISCEPQPA